MGKQHNHGASRSGSKSEVKMQDALEQIGFQRL